MKRFVLIILILSAVLPLAIVGVWYWGIPDDYVSSRIEGLGSAPVSIKVVGFAKAPFFSFRADRIIVKRDSEEILSIGDLAGSLRPFELLKGRVVIHITGNSYGGKFTALITAGKGMTDMSMYFSRLDISRISYARKSGFSGDGELSGSFKYVNGKGSIKFEIDHMIIRSFRNYGAIVPLKDFNNVRGMIDLVSAGNFRIKSLALQGRGIYIRLKGSIVNSLADLEVEVMPEPSFPDKSLLMLIDRYRISNGYYRIPIKRHL
ncbi:hypothetical protein BMS3Abin07_00524 [bacterium BMS3Abin07]|nr:hypothetical protein BMS3Abin07_00524 [bacterium BMS3Abin07]GBE32811.1 hypothetical protein BMS3Bbin05_01734 [bacterium BMS3Bbin05]HDO22197.1 type II secretion system protein GspN [Nitrospirota bacterium]HDZ87973.1 type II secretion system protein GspN [Nitrospirota bacterium]